MKKLAASITATLILTACASKEQLPQQQSNISRVEVTQGKESDVELTITDEQTIAEIVDFINQRQQGWRQPFGGEAEGEVYLTFYLDKRFVGNFYVGDDFYGRDYGRSWIQDADDVSIGKLSQIVGYDMSGVVGVSKCRATHTSAIGQLLRMKKMKKKPMTKEQFELNRDQFSVWCDSEMSNVSYRMHSNKDKKRQFILEIKGEDAKFYGPFKLYDI